MKTLVKNEHLLNLPSDKLQTLHTRADLHRRYSSLTFKVVDCTPGKITVQVVQEKSHNENYFDTKRLVEIVRETFGDLAEWETIHAKPIPYRPAPTEIVTPEWIREQMGKHGLKVKPMALELGIDATSLSAFKNGVRPMSGVVKAMFYYYFKSKTH